MSAESPKRITIPRKGNTGHVVLSQPVSDPTLIDSVAGFIQDVVPQAYAGNSDSREVITWAQVQQADVNDPAFYPDLGDQDGVPPLLLVLGYVSGVQVWIVPNSGEAREVLSWSQGSVRTMCILPNPEPRIPHRKDIYQHKRPLVAMVDNVGPGPQFCSVTFISLRDGDQAKSIKFSHQVWDVVANRRSVVITLAERIAVFDASTLEDNVVVTTCYPSPDVNPIALGTRWLAYADRRLVSQWRSLGGCQNGSSQSVTATVFHAAKFLGKGLRDLGGTVASSLTGGSPENSYTHTPEPCFKGIVTILDIETKSGEGASEEEHKIGTDRILAHFNAHCEPIVALSFDPSGMLLVSADKRGHRFNVFRINTHPCGSTLAYVQHLYILHRGDTTARIQDIAFSLDSRWVAISSMRGTTHVFPITPYGGPVGVRTHMTPHVVNKLSRFHRSAGLSDDGRNSPVLWEGSPSTPPPVHTSPLIPTTVTALAQIRRQSALAPPTEESVIRLAACFSAPRTPSLVPHSIGRVQRPMDSLYVMACNGSLIQYDLEPRHLSGVSKEKICDDTSIELHIEAKAEWVLQRPPFNSSVHPPLACTNPLLNHPDTPTPTDMNTDEDHWLSQVEIVTHAGPHRRLWMGPQFTFITVNPSNDHGDPLDINKQVVRSNPVNMPHKQPLIIESGSCSSLDLSPNMVELVYKTDCSWSCRLREDLAEAMLESPSIRNAGIKGAVRREPVIERQVNPLGTVVTLTAQLNFPGSLLSDDSQVTVIGTETKKISLESTFNKMVTENNLSECVMDQTDLGISPLPLTEANRELDVCSIDFINSNSRLVNNDMLDNKSGKSIFTEVDENITFPQENLKDADVILVTEKRLKNNKPKRKVSKGDKNKPKISMDSKISCDLLRTLEHDDTAMQTSFSAPLPVRGGGINDVEDIETQLREASAERDLDLILPDDCKSCKRGYDITTEPASSILSAELLTHDSEKSENTDHKENEKINLRQRKKSRINDNDEQVINHQFNISENVKYYGNHSLETSYSENQTCKSEEKLKVKKRRSKKPAECNSDELHMNEYNNDDIVTNNSETESTIQMNLCSDIKHDSMKLSFNQEQNVVCTENYECNDMNSLNDDLLMYQTKGIDNEGNEDNFVNDRTYTTDDELKGLEFDALVKDGAWSLEINADILTVTDNKEPDKDIDKVKNYETTDKDSSDDCQPLVVKSDLKHNLKKGKNRKAARKNRDIETKICESEMKNEESSSNCLFKYDTSSQDDHNDEKSTICDENVEVLMKKEDTVERIIVKNNNDENRVMFSNDNTTFSKTKSEKDEKRIHKDKSQDSKDQDLPPFDPPKRSWSSIVLSNYKDSNGNVSKPDTITQAKSLTSVATNFHKSKAPDTEVVKTSSVEDRDSVYESCNDSVGEEVEPAMDSLSSCYFESEAKEEVDNQDSQDIKEEASSESKSASSVEDKSNTDSGEKEYANAGIQLPAKKSRKQKKKKR